MGMIPEQAVEADKAIVNLYITVGSNVPRRLVGKPLIHNGRKPK